MKKSLLVLLLCLCCAPCFSQGVKAGLEGIKTGVKGVSAAGQIEKNLAQQVRRACAASQVRLAQITNMPGQPTVQVRVDASVPVSSAAVFAQHLPAELRDVPKAFDISQRVAQQVARVPVSVRVPIVNFPKQPKVSIQLKAQPLENINKPVVSSARVPDAFEIRYQRQLPAPRSFFTTKAPAFFRGMQLENIDELKNILLNGLEVSKTHYKAIYTSYIPSVALAYAFPSFEAAMYNALDDEKVLPVMVKIVADLETFEKAVRDFSAYHTVFQDIPADKIADVMIFLEINGKKDWYKVTLKEGELVLEEVPTKLVESCID